MSDTVTLMHPDLPDREVEVLAIQATALRKIGWTDAPPRPKRQARPARGNAAAEAKPTASGNDTPDSESPADGPSGDKELTHATPPVHRSR